MKLKYQIPYKKMKKNKNNEKYKTGYNIFQSTKK